MQSTKGIKATSDPDRALRGHAHSFLVRYTGETRVMYDGDLGILYSWMRREGIHPLRASRTDIEMFARYLEDERGNKPASVRRRLEAVRGFYRVMYADEVIIRDPGRMIRLPALHREPCARFGLNSLELGKLIAAAKHRTPQDAALVALMAVMGLRVSTALSFNVGDLNQVEHGHRVLRYTTKLGKRGLAPIPVPVARILDAAAAGCEEDKPLITRRDGNRMDRGCAYRRIKSIAREAGLPWDRVHPHTLRGSAITAALDAGIPVRDVQNFADHADVRMTLRYDHNQFNLDRHPAYMLSGVIAA